MQQEDPRTEQLPAVPAIHPEDPDDEWVTSSSAGRTVRLRPVTGALVVLLLIAGGFWAGVVAEKHHGSGSTGSGSAASRLAAVARGAAGSPAGTGFAGGSRSGLITGTVIDVQGDTVDLSDSNGTIVKVRVGPSTTVTRTSTTGVSGLQIGDTAVVTGSPASGGTISATGIRATAEGVQGGTGFGGFSGIRSGSGG